jgi:hypothetical protein
MIQEKLKPVKNVFFSPDFKTIDWEHDNHERYEYTIDKDNFIEHLNNTYEFGKLVDKAETMSLDELRESFSGSSQESVHEFRFG